MKSRVKEERVYKINNKEILDGPVVYWMNREIRVEDNWSLIYAQDLARENKQPLVVIYNLVPNFLGGQNRQLTFKVDALKEVEKSLKEKNIPFVVLIDKTGKETDKEILNFCNQNKAGVLITDFYPLNISKKWNKKVSSKIRCAFIEVDSHNIVPARFVSNKKEFAAYTIRPKINKLLPEFLEKFPKLKKQEIKFKGKIRKNDWNKILNQKDREELDWIKSGEKEAKKHLNNFIKNKLKNYALDRNDPNKYAQSGFSPYLHYGMISSQRIALDVLEKTKMNIDEVTDPKKNLAKVDLDGEARMDVSVAAFFEELITRKELSDNFCLYEENYDNKKGFPDWAQKTLRKTESDKRDYVYTKKQFEDAKTHDDLWNAAQIEMVKKGKMHGYMRMYWAKKILEWTKNVDDAMEITIYLNDKYELDGRDPNGYAGVAWSLGGVHDRAWFDRKIFGQIRYMARSGCEKKFDVSKYINIWL